ncbi:hypothetical protein ACH5RR_021176 [Cinchona calisaya]|uniref:Uncharacterized protein n=1 Tax=Cinchona calisaya TaxID=153742 RepID=A0ABD2ZJH3_9GENT
MFNAYLSASDEDMPLAAATTFATSRDTSTTNTKMQLFTPTTKNVLEKIAQSFDYSPKVATATVRVKRNLSFAETNLAPNNTSSEYAAKTSTANIKSHPLPQNPAAESPSRRIAIS